MTNGEHYHQHETNGQARTRALIWWFYADVKAPLFRSHTRSVKS